MRNNDDENDLVGSEGNSLLRMLPWVLLAAVFYFGALYVALPQAQTALWKAGNVTAGAYLGYWIDSHALGHITKFSPQGRKVCRAIIIGATILGLSLGL